MKFINTTFDMNAGRVFEYMMLKRLSSVYGIDEIYTENDLRKAYGWKSVGVDFLLVKGDYVVAIQTKYRKTRRRENHGIKSFVDSLEHILAITRKKLLVGFWISRMCPFDDNIQLLASKNIQCLHHFECMDSLLNQATEATVDYVTRAYCSDTSMHNFGL